MNKKTNVSQEAIWQAQANRTGKQGKRNDLTSCRAARSETSDRTLKRARYILNNAPHYVSEIMAGNMMVFPAYEKAKAERLLSFPMST